MIEDEMELKVREVVKRELAAAYQAGYARGAAEEREACAKIAENRHKVWNDGDGIRDGEGLPAVTCDITACENIALAIRSRTGGEKSFTDNVVVSSPYGMHLRSGAFSVEGAAVSPRPSCDGPSSTAYHVPTPVERRPKPSGYVTLAELDEMSMKPAKEPGQ